MLRSKCYAQISVDRNTAETVIDRLWTMDYATADY